MLILAVTLDGERERAHADYMQLIDLSNRRLIFIGKYLRFQNFKRYYNKISKLVKMIDICMLFTAA